MFGIASALALQLTAMPSTPPHRTPIEINGALSIAGGGRCADVLPCPTAWFALALRGEVMAHRPTPRHWGIGGYLSVRTDGFVDLAPSLGLAVLAPVSETFPLVFSTGFVTRFDALGVGAGALERVWFGTRSYNYEYAYTLAAGIFLEAREWRGASQGVDIIAGADIDFELLAIPWIGLYTWIFRSGR